MIDKLKILSELKSHLQLNYGPAIDKVILFGSQSLHHQKSDSDYDVLIVLSKPYTREDENRILDLCYEIDVRYDILLDVHIITKDELNSLRGKQPIYTNALTNGIYA